MTIDLQGCRSGYSTEQLELMDGFGGLLADHCPASLVRRFVEDKSEKADDLCSQLADARWTAAAYPEELGGMGLGLAEVSALLVEAGRVLLPGPFFSSAVLVPIALSLAKGVQKSRLPGITDVVDGKCVASLALVESASVFPGVEVAAKVQGSRISAVKRFVLDAHQADFLLVPALNDEDQPVLAWVPVPSPSVEVLVHPTIDGRRVCTVTLNQAEVAGILPLRGVEWSREFVLRAAVMNASFQLGAAEKALAMAVDYAKTRVQFGRPIGAFQAVSHRLVDLLCNITVGRALLQKAARAADQEFFLEAASRSKIWLNDAYRAVAKGALQTFGGIGFTFEHDIHLYFRSSHALATEFGSSADHRALLRSSFSLGEAA